MKTNYSYYITKLLYINAITGFPVIAIVPDIIKQPSQTITVAYRGLTLFLTILSIAVAYKERKTYQFTIFSIAHLIFWCMIFIRFFLDLEIYQIQTMIPRNYYWSFGLVGIFVPTIAFLILLDEPTIGKFLKEVHSVSTFGMFSAVVLNTFVALFVSPMNSLAQLNIWRISSSVLSSISLGHLGVTLIILAVTNFPQQKLSLAVCFRVLCILAGISILALSGSRGPVLALLICIIILILSQSSIKSKLIFLFIALIMGYLIYFFMVTVEENTTYRTLSRYTTISDINSDESSANRLSRFSLALDQFVKSPIWGDSMVVRETLDYPHNLVIEAFMALGVIGGLILIFLILKSVLSALSLLRYHNTLWVGLLYFQFLTGAFVSGSMFLDANFWYWSIIVVTVSVSIEQAKSYSQFSLTM